jgi:hypothetical protein
MGQAKRLRNKIAHMEEETQRLREQISQLHNKMYAEGQRHAVDIMRLLATTDRYKQLVEKANPVLLHPFQQLGASHTYSMTEKRYCRDWNKLSSFMDKDLRINLAEALIPLLLEHKGEIMGIALTQTDIEPKGNYDLYSPSYNERGERRLTALVYKTDDSMIRFMPKTPLTFFKGELDNSDASVVR